MLIAQGKLGEARKLAQAERDSNEKLLPPWQLLIRVAGDRKEMASVVDEAERATGRRPEWLIARARLALGETPEEARRQLASLEGRLVDFKGPDLDRALATLAEASAAAGDQAASRRLYDRYVERNPDELTARTVLFEAALRGKDETDAKFQLAHIRGIEGGDGHWTAYGEASLRLMSAKGTTPPHDEVHALLARAIALRPSWTKPLVLQGALYEQEGKKDKALEKYQAAIEGGEGNLGVIRRTLQLLGERQQFAEVEALVQKLPEQALTATNLGRMAAEITLVNQTAAGQDPETMRRQAVELARKSVAPDSKDHRDHIWLGQMAAAAGEKDEAEKALRRACKLNPTAPESWAALILFLARIDPKKADVEIQEAQRQLPKDKAPLALAACYESLGRPQQADEQYRLLLTQQPTDLGVLFIAANYYSRAGQPAQAEPLLRKLIDPSLKAPETTITWARRALALTLAAQGNQARLQEAQALIEENRKREGANLENRRVQAILLASQPGQRGQAIKACEDLSTDIKTVPEQMRLLLAQLHEADSNWPAAERVLLSLVQENERNPVNIARYIQGLVRNGKAEAAESWVERLAGLAPLAPGTLDLQILVYRSTGKKDEAKRIVRAYAKKPDSRPELAARWFEQVDLVDDAERSWQSHVQNTKDSRGPLALAGFYGRHGRIAEALAICEKALSSAPPQEVISVSVALVRGSKATPEQQRRVEGWVQAAIDKQPSAAYLAMARAELCELQGRYADAIGVYREILRPSKDNFVAMNNLAYLLARHEGKAAEALALIARALELQGPVDELLDTRATIHLCGKDGEAAAQDLEQALAQRATPDRHFHLALAELQRGRQPAARKAFQQARQMGLREDGLHPLERPAWRELSELFQ